MNDTYGVGEDMQLYSPDNITFGESAVCLNFRKESIIGKYWDRQEEYGRKNTIIPLL